MADPETEQIAARSIQFSNQLSIRRDPEDVFAFVADFSEVPTWNYAIRSTQQVTPGPVALGSTFRQVRTIPTVAEEEFEVTAWEPGRRVAITGDFGPFSGTLTYQVEPAPAGTLLTNDVELSPRGVLGVVGRIAGPRVRAAIAQNLEVLRSGLESG